MERQPGPESGINWDEHDVLVFVGYNISMSHPTLALYVPSDVSAPFKFVLQMLIAEFGFS